MKNLHIPDTWVILEIKSKNSLHHKIFGGWYGGYTSGDSWKISSGIKTFVNGDKDFYESLQLSDSIYRCYKQSYKMSFYMSQMYDNFSDQLKSLDSKLRVLTEDEMKSFKI